jgi:hypothetical protein
MREPTAGRRSIPVSGPEIETLVDNVRLFAKRHQPCGRLWIDANPPSTMPTSRRITVACLCGDTLDETVSGHNLGGIVEALARLTRPHVA